MNGSSSSDPAARFWQQLARRLAWRVNLAAWWERWITPAVVIVALAAMGVLALRRQGLDTRDAWLAGAAALLACGVWAARRARRHFFTPASALVELDVALGLKTRLSAASSGVGSWPEIPADGRVHVLRWKPSRLLVPPAFAAALLAAAGFIPVNTARDAEPTGRRDTPAAWQEMEAWLKNLDEQGLAKPEAVEAWEERVSRLRQQPESAWYGHDSLEAGDTLHQQLEVGLRNLGNDLDDAADAVEALDSVGGKSHDADSQGAGQLDRAMERLEAGTVPLHPKLLAQLKSAAGQQGRSLSMTELQKLQRRLREGAGFSRLQIRECKAGHKECSGGRCLGRGRSKSGHGVGRGPGEAPMTLAEEASRTDSQRLEGVANEDLQHSALGDTIGMTRSGHSVDRAPVASMSGGTVSTAPTGGETVWRDALTPEEQRVLQRYFK